MPSSPPSCTRPAVLLLALGLAACGDDQAPADPACPDAADPCQCDATLPECSGESTSSGASSVTGDEPSGGIPTTAAASDDDTAASSGSAGDAAVFSVLPPYDMVGAEWVYENENLAADVIVENRCSIADVFEWPDGRPGATWRCLQDGTPLQDQRYALHPDRIELREVGMLEYELPMEIFRVPVEVGDEWQTEWRIPSVTEGMASWVVVGTEPIDLPFGSFEAAKLERTTTSPAGTSVSTLWWVDGIGTVRSLSEEVRAELVSFSLP